LELGTALVALNVRGQSPRTLTAGSYAPLEADRYCKARAHLLN